MTAVQEQGKRGYHKARRAMEIQKLKFKIGQIEEDIADLKRAMGLELYEPLRDAQDEEVQEIFSKWEKRVQEKRKEKVDAERLLFDLEAQEARTSNAST